LGYRPNSTKGKNSYRLPFTPPPLWSPELVLHISNSWNVDQLFRFYALSFDYSRVQVYTIIPGLLAVSGLSVLAAVYGLLHSKIQRQQLLTDLGLVKV
jgi:hypothetical protein